MVWFVAVFFVLFAPRSLETPRPLAGLSSFRLPAVLSLIFLSDKFNIHLSFSSQSVFPEKFSILGFRSLPYLLVLLYVTVILLNTKRFSDLDSQLQGIFFTYSGLF